MKHVGYFSFIITLVAFLLSSSAHSQNSIMDQRQNLDKAETLNTNTAYNVRLAIRLNGKTIATPQITMLAGKAQIIANNPTTINPYKIQITLLDKEKIKKKFPAIDLKNPVAETVFIEAGLFLPKFLSDPVNQWRKIAAPASFIKTDGQLLQITTDISKSSLTMIHTNKPITELSWDINVFPVYLTPQ